MTAAMETPRPGMLAGVRVVDFSRVLAGPLCTMILADLGAEVIKVEEPGAGDQTRAIPPLVNGLSHYFLAVNRNKRSVALDLKRAEGVAIALRLVRHADVVVENFRPGVMERLGLGYARLQAERPGLIVCSISGFGQDGTLSGRPSFDLVTQALSGVMSINGEAQGPPTKLGLPMGDLAGGLWGAIGVLGALHRHQTRGEGAHIDLSLLDGLLGLLGYLGELFLVTGESPGRVGSGHHSIVPYGRFPVRDGHIILALHQGSFWRKFCRAVGRDDLAENPRFRTTGQRRDRREELEAIVTGILARKTLAEWQRIFDEADIPNAPVHDIGQALTQPYVRERGLVAETPHPLGGSVPLVRGPLRLRGGGELPPLGPPPLLGEHTRAVLATLAGCDGATIERLIAEGVAAEADRRGPGTRDHGEEAP
ncbi:MAG: CoA transferase [Candidatus Lambdaproteobacteria bacterium]|nr:CoA transferase [Candidatus Lambdaproteobacteria bacterium]